MPGGLWSGVKRFVLWNYPRASWQYDVMVGLILVFVFLTPPEWFRDQPRIPNARNVAMLPADHGDNVFWLDTELLAGTSASARSAKVEQILERQTGKKHALIRLEPIRDSEDELKGYMAFTKSR